MTRFMTVDEVLYLYEEMSRQSGEALGNCNLHELNQVLERPLTQFEGEDIYPDLFTKVAVLLYGFILIKPFSKGNKRMGLLCSIYTLQLNGHELICSAERLVDLALGTEAGLYKVDHLIQWIENNSEITAKLDKVNKA